MAKKRVLVVSEAHYVLSGFGTYANELLTRLAKTDKYELAEFASYGHYSAVNNLDWTFYANAPEEGEDSTGYDPNGTSQFGAWRFDRVCLDFKPDIVLSYRDPWMDMFIKSTPTRPYFHWVWMPTVDSEPQKQEWVHGFAEADALFVYSEFGQRVLEKQATKSLNIIGCASPGIDPSVYKPILNKRAHKESFKLDPDCFIVGSVMRNQKRKLFIELMKSFRIFLDNAPKEIADKTYLYLHTSYPEKTGWDIAEGIISTNLSGKVLMTYKCRNCSKFDLGFFEGPITKCKHCEQFASQCPNVTFGLTIPELVQVYNLFDLYVQYAICEGFGMPQVEAGACGVPIAATNYSAMEDVLEWLKGYKINVGVMARELETNAERAYPDNNHLAEIIEKHFSLSEEKRIKKAIQVRTDTKKRYTWNQTAEAWEKYVDSYTPTDNQGKWDSPPKIYPLPESIPEGLDNQQFVIWIFSNILQESHRAFGYEGNQLLCDLTCGATMRYGSIQPIDREKIFQEYKDVANNRMNCEKARVGILSLTNDAYLDEAHKRKKS